jgi:hypothetical protein
MVTGFPGQFTPDTRCGYLACLLGKSVEKFTSTSDGVWFHVHSPYQVKYYIDKIIKPDFNGHKLSATVSKQLPVPRSTIYSPHKPRCIDEQSKQPKTLHRNDVSINFQYLWKFLTILTILIILIYGFIFWLK